MRDITIKDALKIYSDLEDAEKGIGLFVDDADAVHELGGEEWEIIFNALKLGYVIGRADLMKSINAVLLSGLQERDTAAFCRKVEESPVNLIEVKAARMAELTGMDPEKVWEYMRVERQYREIVERLESSGGESAYDWDAKLATIEVNTDLTREEVQKLSDAEMQFFREQRRSFKE